MGLRSLETELLLARVLQEVAAGEHRVELRRCALSQLRDFTPMAAFQYFDRYNLHRIDSFDLLRYVQTRGLPYSESLVKAIIQQYDGNGDGKLYESEFYQLLLPSTDVYWREEALSRIRPTYLSVPVSNSLQDLLESELAYHRSVEQAKVSLITRPDFHAFSAFQSLDATNTGYIDRAALKWFLRKHSCDATEADIDAIFRRWDTDDDERLAFREFADALAPINPVSSTSPRENTVDLPKVTESPPRKTEETESKPAKTGDMTLEELKEDLPKESKVTVSESQASLRSSKSPYWPPPPLPSVSEEEKTAVVELMQEQVENLKELEAVRQEVGLCADFTIEDAFQLLDLKDSGTVDLSDFTSALDQLGIKVYADDASMLLQRYSNEPTLSLRSLRNMVESGTADAYNRLRSSQRLRSSEKSVGLRQSTKVKFSDLLRILLHIEHRNEVRRQSFQQLSEFRPALLFGLMDVRNRGYIGASEVVGM